MESLLRWSIENTPANLDRIQPTELDPGIIDTILGKPDSEQMKEDLAIALDETRDADERVTALDHFEMLVEQIDNANNLERLRMWEPLQSLLTSSSSTPDIKIQALWAIGTALQNNPAAQNAYLNYHPLPVLTSFLQCSPSTTPEIRSKVIYTLSGLLKHNAHAVEALGAPDLDGWNTFNDTLQDPNISVRRKTIFLLNTLLTPTETLSLPQPASGLQTTQPQPIHPNSHDTMVSDPSSTSTSPHTMKALVHHGLLSTIISSLTNPVPYGEDGDQTDADPEFEEKAVRLLHTYASTCGGQFSDAEKKTLKPWFDEQKQISGSKHKLTDRWGLSMEELISLLDGVD